jgi:probable F420-dependent oxidoreductase
LSVQIGIVSPVVVRYPGVASAWEATADITDLARIATTADRLGFHHLTCSEHVAVPSDVADQRGGSYWDPLATLGYLAAVTERIRLVPQVVVLGYHHPLAIAKRYGTLDRVSGGRLTLGLGVGSLREEFELLGAPFADRGARADEALLALRAAFATATPEFHGSYYDFAGFVVEPRPVQQRVPLWIGGRTLRSLRRAVTSGDGWVPFGLAGDELAALLQRVELPPGFDVVLSAGRPMDPIGDPDGARRALARAESLGATITGTSISATSAEHYCEQLDALRELLPCSPEQAQEEQ